MKSSLIFLYSVFRWERHTDKESWLTDIKLLIARSHRQRLFHTVSAPEPSKHITYLRIATAAGDNIIAKGLSRGHFSHLLTNVRRIRPCATYMQVNLAVPEKGWHFCHTAATSAGFSPFISKIRNTQRPLINLSNFSTTCRADLEAHQ